MALGSCLIPLPEREEKAKTNRSHLETGNISPFLSMQYFRSHTTVLVPVKHRCLLGVEGNRGSASTAESRRHCRFPEILLGATKLYEKIKVK